MRALRIFAEGVTRIGLDLRASPEWFAGMSGLSQARVTVAGGGALGSSIAIRLAQAGARVTLVDPDDAALSASGVAAGMLAPALECVLDPAGGLSFELLRAARDLWPTLTERLGGADIGLRRTGALWLDLPGAPPQGEAVVAGLRRIGARLAQPPTDYARGPAEAAVYTPEDWRLSPRAALSALRRGLRNAGGVIIAARVEAFEQGVAHLSDGSRHPADHLIAATGAEGAQLAPELASLVPIKGQLVKYPALRLPEGTPTIRCAEGYATGGEDGLCVGATMEPGVRDLSLDPAVTARLHALATQLYTQAARMTPLTQAGVRAATRHGAVLIGPSVRDGVWLAAGARRNGWLLAPLAAEIILADLEARDAGPWAAAFRPQADQGPPPPNHG